MLYPQVRGCYVAALESVSIPPASEQQTAYIRKDSTLLGAFVTAKVIQKLGWQKAVSTMKQDKSRRYFYPRFAGDPMESDSFSSLFTVDFLTFLRHVTPSLAADPEAFLVLCSGHGIDDIRDQGHHLISINLLACQLEQEQFFAQIHGADDVLDHVYRFYCTRTCANMELLRRDIFEEMYRAILHYPLDERELSMGPLEQKARAAAEILVLEMRESRASQRSIIRDFLVNKLSCRTVEQRNPPSPFSPCKEPAERIKWLDKAQKNILQSTPLDLLRVFSLAYGGTKNRMRNNDITLENGLVFSVYLSHLTPFSDTDEQAIIFFPSPSFVYKWAVHEETRYRKTTFICATLEEMELYQLHFSTPAYAGQAYENFEFLYLKDEDVETWLPPEAGKKMLFFAPSAGVHTKRKWYRHLLNTAAPSTDLLILEASSELELRDSSQEKETLRLLIDDMVSMMLIPQGIYFSTTPRRKILIRCTVGSRAAAAQISLSTLSLSHDFPGQFLAKIPIPTVSICREEFQKLNTTIRSLFRDELLNQRHRGRERDLSFDVDFTEDIKIWCSKSFPKNNSGRPRLEAYICEPPSEEKVKRGYRPRGKVIPSTKKRVVTVHDDGLDSKDGKDVLWWLTTQYPFSMVAGRRSAKQQAEAEETVSDRGGEPLPRKFTFIRDEITNHYLERLNGANIALKTLWYLHPEMEDCFSGHSNFVVFQEMVCYSEIGSLRVADLTPESIQELLEACYPDENQERLIARFLLISNALDFACRCGYCRENSLAPVVREGQLSQKLFAQVRRALVSRSLDLGQLHTVFDWILERIYQQDELEYIGVLIRLLLGLESNIVCALTWQDIHLTESCGITYLSVHKQCTNDGTQLCGFSDLEDYRNLPCIKTLLDALDHVRQRQKELSPHHPPAYIMGETRLEKGSVCFPPVKLDQLCRKALKTVALPDHIIPVPDNMKGSKETNLSKYYGDFFRMNFSYWLRTTAQFNTDELQYVLGNQAQTTFGHYYCDFLADSSQLILLKKLQRWEAVLVQRSAAQTRARRICAAGQAETELSLPGKFPLWAHIHIASYRDQEEIHVNIESQYGCKTHITYLEQADAAEGETYG